MALGQNRRNRLMLMNWSYLSGFFDGEGGISVFGRVGSNALALKVTICQKSLDVIHRIRAFLALAGIHSDIYHSRNGMHIVEIRRIEDLCRFFRSVESIVKGKQVTAALDYLQSRINGNTFLKIYEVEYMDHKRKTNPVRKIGLRFPMTREQAVEAAKVKSRVARFEGHRRSYVDRIERRVNSLPKTFGVKDIERVVGVSKKRAQFLGILMSEKALSRAISREFLHVFERKSSSGFRDQAKEESGVQS